MPALLVLTHGQDIAVWILEPRHFVTIGSCPDPAFAILDERILFQSNALFVEPGDYRIDVVDFPAQDGALDWREIRNLGNSDVVPASFHHQRILVEADEFELQLAFIKSSRLVVILGENKA